MKLSEAESILFFISDNDPLKAEEIKKKIKRKKVLDYLYKIRIAQLNELIAAIAQLKHMEKENKNHNK